ncbi:DJ-1/PfpI family protein [Rouxiella badensis]|uniref:Thiamine biosynthesis protein ThiJ n=1 Tax=Rouxiella badensis TaxID=1646377 RepID=A0A1X0WA34_9GAMM|nr:DJ-1/PfpI family protein [Rouxiella badensis]MCC3702910.1 DJ-1/PfpI family protein [Rouxiella badensis]MCC3720238.1 DJ-1/PfpI family protein [Rouxiella badensis]MCC3729901.1 DJ-1/PfpI family protein [Rouxiella badensis]MCC3733916.1 DJ-1/PfpI family protein [Rouxiella badensis]MCC3741388.1 DJ-1/PfpI family protein [Rouxiella badensis]
MNKPLTVVFPLYPGVTQLDFTGPWQVLMHLPGARLIAASLGGESIVSEGLNFASLQPLESLTECDVLCVPGGGGCTDAMKNPDFISHIQRLADNATYVTSVCTGSLILAAAGILRGKRAACHWMYLDTLAWFGAIPVSERVVRDGNIFSGGGVTAGIDFALTLVAELAGEERAQRIQLGLEYAPAPPFNAGHPDVAPAALVAQQLASTAALRERRRQIIQEISLQ